MHELFGLVESAQHAERTGTAQARVNRVGSVLFGRLELLDRLGRPIEGHQHAGVIELAQPVVRDLREVLIGRLVPAQQTGGDPHLEQDLRTLFAIGNGVFEIQDFIANVLVLISRNGRLEFLDLLRPE